MLADFYHGLLLLFLWYKLGGENLWGLRVSFLLGNSSFAIFTSPLMKKGGLVIIKKDPIMEAKLDELWRNGHAEELRYLSDSRFNILMNSVFLGMLVVIGADIIEGILVKPILQKLKEKTK